MDAVRGRESRSVKVTAKECTMYPTEPLSADLAKKSPQSDPSYMNGSLFTR